MDISVDDLRTYARCPLEWFWERQVGVEKPQTIAVLFPVAVKTGLEFFYEGHVDSFSTAVGLVWQDWCEGWGETPLVRDLAQYASGRTRILELFTTGRVQRPDGGRYAVPEMTTEYRTRMHSAGLTKLGRSLDEFAQTHGLLIPDGSNQPGSVFGDAYADCLTAAERMAPDLPAPSVVLGRATPFEVNLGNGVRLLGQANLLIRAEAEPKNVVIEVHDFEPAPWVRAGIASRDLRVVSAILARPILGNEQSKGANWDRVEYVRYRHWPTGQTFTFREANTGHLMALVAAVSRGMLHHVVIPRAMTGYENCRACGYREHCWGQPGWEALPLVDGGLLGWAEAHKKPFQKLRQAMEKDPALAVHLNGSLPILEQTLDGLPEASLLASVRQLLEITEHGHE